MMFDDVRSAFRFPILFFFCGFLGCHVPLANLDSGPHGGPRQRSQEIPELLGFPGSMGEELAGASDATVGVLDHFGAGGLQQGPQDAPVVVRPCVVPLQTWLAGKSTIDERAFTIKTSMYKGFSIATFDDRKSICYYPLHILEHIFTDQNDSHFRHFAVH